MLVYPRAKINLGLYVTARRPDGYHDLQTVFYPIPLCDVIETKPLSAMDAAPYVLRTEGYAPCANPEDNLVVRVYRDMAREFDLPPLDILLQKRVPMGAGLGGGSSDAAAMMTGLNEEYGLGLTDDEMERRIAPYGADCAFFIRSRAAWATGIGDRLTPYPLSLAGYHLVLVKPDVFVSTREAYAGITPRTPRYDLRESLQRPIAEWRDTVSNDFEEGVFALHPEIAAIKQTLYDMGALYASMSGSGSTVFAIFGRPVPEAARVFAKCFVYTKALVR